MPFQMIVHEGGDEIIGVIVAVVQAQRQADIRVFDRLFEQPWPQALFQETIGLALIDQEFGKTRTVLHQ